MNREIYKVVNIYPPLPPLPLMEGWELMKGQDAT